MSRLRDELAVVPIVGRVLAAITYLGLVTFIALGCWFEAGDGHDRMPLALCPLLLILPPLFAAFYVLLLGYVYGDARRRGMNYIAWTILAFLVPNALGIVIYFIMRAPLGGGTCPHCNSRIPSGSIFCNRCGTKVAPASPANQITHRTDMPSSA